MHIGSLSNDETNTLALLQATNDIPPAYSAIGLEVTKPPEKAFLEKLQEAVLGGTQLYLQSKAARSNAAIAKAETAAQNKMYFPTGTGLMPTGVNRARGNMALSYQEEEFFNPRNMILLSVAGLLATVLILQISNRKKGKK